MPRKPARRQNSDDPISAEERRLLEQQRELEEKAKRLNELIRTAPQREQEIRKRRREAIRIDVAAANRPVGIGGLSARRPEPAPARRRPRRRSERNIARVKFVFLCLILLTIFFLIWRQIP